MKQVTAFASFAAALLLASGCAGVEVETAASSPIVKDLTLASMPPGWQPDGAFPHIYFHRQCSGPALFRDYPPGKQLSFTNSQVSNSQIGTGNLFLTHTALPDAVTAAALMRRVQNCSGEEDADLSYLSRAIGGPRVYVDVSRISVDLQDPASIEAYRVYSRAKINPDPNASPTSSVVYIAFIKGDRGVTHLIDMWTLFEGSEAPYFRAFREVLERIVSE